MWVSFTYQRTHARTQARTFGGHLAAAGAEGGADLLEAAVVVLRRLLGAVAGLRGAVLEGALSGDGAAGRVAAVGAGAHLGLLGCGLLASQRLFSWVRAGVGLELELGRIEGERRAGQGSHRPG